VRADAQIAAEAEVAMLSRIRWRVLPVRALILGPHWGSRCGC
jgi:hypothetical protein